MTTESRELVLITRAEHMLAEARTIDECRHVRDIAEAARTYAKKAGLSQDIIVHASAIKVQAERKLGQMLMVLELANAAPGNQYTGKLDQSHDATGPLRLRDLGISKSDSSRVQQIASLHDAVFAEYVQGCVQSQREPTTTGLLRLAHKQKPNDTTAPSDDRALRIEAGLQKLIDEGLRFSTVYADPPWGDAKQGRGKSRTVDFPTMTVKEIAALPVPQLITEHCHLHLWTTNAFLPAAFSVMRAWKFQYKACFIWAKTCLGSGEFWQISHEYLLLGVRGNLPFRDLGQRSWMELEASGSTRTPQEIRALVEQVSPAPYLELYGRSPCPNAGWTAYADHPSPSP